ncbi:hypothetical protein [Streptomyces longispororuber]|uniref:hypothetical protein n=1 Tax=Streptomyces longispororuber TaxID=68230 RepID=UPI0036F8DC65
MSERKITVDEAAQKAGRAATRAEELQKTLEIVRLRNLQAASERGVSRSRMSDLEQTVDDTARARDEMISVASMWAHVASALHLTEEGKRP